MHTSSEWNDYWEEGIRYLEIVERAYPNKRAFTAEILYHMLGMALEKMFMAWMGTVGTLPENHTVRDLVRGADAIETLPSELRKDLLRFDRFMALCSLIPVPMAPPTLDDIPDMVKVVHQTKSWIGDRYLATVA